MEHDEQRLIGRCEQKGPTNKFLIVLSEIGPVEHGKRRKAVVVLNRFAKGVVF